MIRILTDSTADFPASEAAALGLRVVPLQVNFGDEHYRDGIDLTPEAFFEMLEQASKLPTTSQPSPELFLNEFEDAKAAGDEAVSYTHLDVYKRQVPPCRPHPRSSAGTSSR